MTRVAIVRMAALIRVLDTEPALDATHGLFTMSLACHDSPCTVSGYLFDRLTPELTRQPRHGTEYGWTSISLHSVSQQYSSNNALIPFALNVLALNARQRDRREKDSRPWCVCSIYCVDECPGGVAKHAPNQPLR